MRTMRTKTNLKLIGAISLDGIRTFGILNRYKSMREYVQSAFDEAEFREETVSNSTSKEAFELAKSRGDDFKAQRYADTPSCCDTAM